MEYKKKLREYEELVYRPRPIYHHHRMETAHRAKQFAPFAALRGFETAVGSKDGTFWQMELLEHPLEELESVYVEEA